MFVFLPGEKSRSGSAGLSKKSIQVKLAAFGRSSEDQRAVHPLENPPTGSDDPHVSPDEMESSFWVLFVVLKACVFPQTSASRPADWHGWDLPLHQRRTQHDPRADPEVLQEAAGGERSQRHIRGADQWCIHHPFICCCLFLIGLHSSSRLFPTRCWKQNINRLKPSAASWGTSTCSSPMTESAACCRPSSVKSFTRERGEEEVFDLRRWM